MKREKHPLKGKRAMNEPNHPQTLLLCLSPSMKEAVVKVKNWINNLANKTEKRGASEVHNTLTEKAQPIFNNDYAPPVVKKEIESLPIPEDLRIEATDMPRTLKVCWKKSANRQLYLLQVNIENPENPTCWITHSVSTQPWLDIEDVETDKPLWVRVCVLGNEGRGKWSLVKK